MKKDDLSDFEHDMFVGGRWAVIPFQNYTFQKLIYWDFPSQQSLEFTGTGLKKGQILSQWHFSG